MKILVTGAAGFIGAYTVRALRSAGHNVVGIDNFSTYYDPSLKEARVTEFLEGTTLVRGDIADRTCVESLFKDHRFDRVCHLAAQAGVRYSIENPWSYVSANVVGTQHIFECAKHAGGVPVVYASSSSVYGDSTPVPFSEDAPCVEPVSLYAATKRSSELIAYTYTHLFGLPTTGLRFFTVYGPWGRPDMAYFTFTKAMLRGQTIERFNRGDLMRDFTYIDDIVTGVVSALVHPEGCHLYNLGRGAPVRLGDFISSIETAVGKSATVVDREMQPGDVHATYADTSRARADLGYAPSVDLEEGIPRFVKWYRSYYNE